MERRETPLLVILGVLFLAMAGWLGLAAWQSFSDPIHTTLAVPVTVEETVSLEGIVLREERVLSSALPCRVLFARTGERVASGALLAAGCSDGAEVSALRQLWESQRLLALTREETGETAAGYYTAAVSRRDMAAAGAGALAMGTESGAVGTAVLAADAALLEYRLSGGVEWLYAPESGLFFPAADGYEHLSPQLLAQLTGDKLEELLTQPPQPVAGAWGRLITGNSWYCAAFISPEEAAALVPGTTPELELPGGGVEVEIFSLTPDGEERWVLVLRCATAMGAMAPQRFVTGELVTRRLRGLQLPETALRRDERGDYVYLAAGLMAQRVDVSILREENGFVLVEGDGLHAGSEILIGGSRLYDGCLL